MNSGIIPVIAAAFIGLHAPANAQTTAPAAPAPASSPVVARGAVVRLKGGTPLTFQQRVVRATGRNEEFVVLDVRKDQQALYLSLVDTSGMEIAVTAPSTSATLIEHTELGERIAKAVSKGQNAAALALVSNWGNEASQREEVTKAINELKATEVALAAATNATSAAQAEAKRTLRHAEATGNVGENSAFARAAENRRQLAAKIETNAQEKLKEAQTNRDDALAAFRTAIGVEVRAQPVANRRAAASDYIKDPPEVPSIFLSRDISPSYDETVAFINGKLKENGQKLWFGRNSKRIIIESLYDVGVFNPTDASTTVKYETGPKRIGESFPVKVVATGERDVFEFYGKSGPRLKPGSVLYLNCADQIDAEKVANAMSHLIQMFGGKKDPF